MEVIKSLARFPDLSIGFRKQLVLTFSIGVGLLAAISSFAITHYSSKAVRQLLIEQGHQVVETLASQSTLALLYSSPENAQVAAEATMAFPDVLGVAIYDIEGNPLLKLGKFNNLPIEPYSTTDAVGLVADRAEGWYFVAPVYAGNLVNNEEDSPFATVMTKRELLGHVFVVMGKKTLKIMEKNILQTNVLVSTTLAGILLILLLAITTRMTTPLKNLADKMRRAEEGEETVRADLSGPKDIIDMEVAFNTMMQVLEERERELKRARDAALKSARAKAEFASNVSHEIRTPMNGVLGMLELLQGMGLTQKQTEYVEVARNSAESQLALIEDILDFSRIDSGKIKPNPIDFRMSDLLDEVVQISSGQAQRKDLDLGYLVEHDVPAYLRGEPTRIRQVLTNLVGNAIKFTEKGEIAIKVRYVNQVDDKFFIRFEVIDTGIGISEQARQRIFEPFAQVDGSTTRKYKGVGLGLSICRQVVSFMGGEIEVESVLGKGSTFRFELPLKVANQTSEATHGLYDEFADLRVLVADDSSISRSFIENTLELWGVHHESASDSTAALKLLREAAQQRRPFDIVIVDESMPGINSKTLTRKIIEDDVIPLVRIIVMTNHPSELQNGVVYGGIDDYIVKPVRQSVLFNSISTLLDPPVDRIPVNKTERLEIQDSIHLGKRVLIVEDNRINQQVALGMLERLGCEVEIAETGKEALEAVSRKTYDMVLMDCQMPEMDGYEATRRIRLMENNERHQPIVAMTADVQAGASEQCIEAGMDDYLPKPVRLNSLNEKLCRWTADHPSADSNHSSEQSDKPKPTTEDESNPLNAEIFNELRKNLGDAFTRMVEAFCEDIPKYLLDLKQAISESDHKTTFSIAHTIKGSSRNFGADRLAEISKRVEDIGRSGSIHGAGELLPTLFEECDRVIATLHREVGLNKLVGAAKSDNLQRVLVVDDDRAMRLAIRQVLEKEGYRIESATNGSQAIAICKRQMPDVILMDAVMPEVDGFTACKQIRNLPDGKHTPILMITALEDEHSIEHAFSVGATDYVPKPLNFTVLRGRLHRLLHVSRAEQHIRHLAYNDPLTGLPNRTMFMDRLGELLVQMRGKDELLAILFLDLDRFKMVNDTMGHELGDRLLRAAADRIVHCVRSSDLVARLGGDEFTILLERMTSPKAVASIAEKICNALSQPFSFLGREIYISTSIGISICPQDGRDIGTLMKHADTAMFRAKEKGGRYQFYEFGMEAEVTKKLEIEADLRRALEGNELTLYYQPQIDLKTRTVVGMEALVRWKHPVRGMIPPSDFIPIAEETGLIIPLGELILRQACFQAQTWFNQGLKPLRVAVNLSGRQLENRELTQMVASVLEDSGLYPSYLELELTESTVMENAEEVIPILTQLKDMGLTLAIDDFGTGYSSLSYLRKFPIDLLKIDASFVRDITHDPDDRALISGIIALAKSIRLKVLAEGVETSEQEAFLIEQGCDLIQGYLISAPLEASLFEQQILCKVTDHYSNTNNVTPFRKKSFD